MFLSIGKPPFMQHSKYASTVNSSMLPLLHAPIGHGIWIDPYVYDDAMMLKFGTSATKCKALPSISNYNAIGTYYQIFILLKLKASTQYKLYGNCAQRSPIKPGFNLRLSLFDRANTTKDDAEACTNYVAQQISDYSYSPTSFVLDGITYTCELSYTPAETKIFALGIGMKYEDDYLDALHDCLCLPMPEHITYAEYQECLE